MEMVEFEISISSPTSVEENICRVCLAHVDVALNIFEEQYAKDDTEQIPLLDKLYELLQIRYEQSVSLPAGICDRCLDMSKALIIFRDSARKTESDLQDRLQKYGTIFVGEEEQRPGLNGNPGVFEPEEDCIVREVNPDADPSSDEDFLMETDSEVDANQVNGPANDQSVIPSSTSAAVSPSVIADNITPSTPIVDTAPPTAETVCTQSIPDDVFFENASMDKSSSSFVEPGNSNVTTAAISDTSTTEYAPKNAFLCQYCDVAFTSQADCTEHEGHHDSVAPYLCNFCPMRTTTRQNIIAHIKESHDSERPFICVLCSKGFGRRSDLKKHTIVHTGVRPFTCNVCSKSFSRNTNLTKHMRIHSSGKPHVCQRCPRSFQTAIELHRHIRSHMEIKPFPCNRCIASFTRRDKLVLHQRSHSRRDSEQLLNQTKVNPNFDSHVVGEDTLQLSSNTYSEVPVSPLPNIEETYRTSILAAQLQQQQRPAASRPSPSSRPLHSRIFTCELCNKSFTRECDLHRHRALHLDKLFACKECGEGFNRREQLLRHEQQHVISQHLCDICHQEFNNKAEFEEHMKMHEIQQTVSQTILNVGPSSQLTMPNSLIAPPPPMISTPAQSAEFQLPPVTELSFFRQIVPNMNLGFYNETHPEERNGI